ncbi:uncharacterized protein LOC129770881 isoform X1 [Toxorhynchites rutilus septentrionalis]|nr:uncharacterized protein LOC129770881 isoform X1 [Toxorhynchites rutilus septentrionalis]XP_055630020.1 uncharacterized protein LOC129770881 isoform X1 [Toxorhynchites rutilus septentrionalis]XP_055630021.1 uncharacterized protein LOC129770881 isoform X1 [Toxorhynchites rutilus septentrionalis]XP_055630022.1 uncharacterized protein LOC129770881 isoform X1 [Toxorhynchites rutilus septentrionalis]XP_055630023.1 uncharacterized protein LOC129770881 isoform X1 [Toxorhynchites rutilus septentriona
MAAPQLYGEEVYVRRRGEEYPPVSMVNGRHVYLNDSAIFYDSAESIPANVTFRNRRRYNESLSSLNESDYGVPYDSTADEYQDEEPITINKQHVASSLSRFGAILQMLSKIPFPRMSVTGMGLSSLVAIFICPRTLGANILFPGFRLLFGTLYPAYASYKAVRTKNVKEYVKWMMYWIVFAFFTCIETFTDILLSWFPFYYEIKVIIVLWLLSPATRGSSTLYRKFVHPMLTRREQEIDDYINQAKEKGYTAVLQLGSKGVNYATNVIMQTAIKGGGGLVQTLRKSYSLSDLSEPDTQRTQEEIDELIRPQRVLRSKSARSSSGGRHVEMYFPEVEIAGTPHRTPPPYNYIRSSDDISSGYSSAEPGLSRTASMSNTARPRVKSKTREDDDEVFYSDRETARSYGTSSQFIHPATLYEIPSSPLPAITEASHSPNPNEPPIFSSQFPLAGARATPHSLTPEMGQKYELFLQWMESQKESKPISEDQKLPTELIIDSHNAEIETKGLTDVETMPADDIPFIDDTLPNEEEQFSTCAPMMAPIPEAEQSENSFADDVFRDTISVSSEDEFQELEQDEIVAESTVEITTALNNSKDIIETNKNVDTEIDVVESVTDKTMPTVLEVIEEVTTTEPLATTVEPIIIRVDTNDTNPHLGSKHNDISKEEALSNVLRENAKDNPNTEVSISEKSDLFNESPIQLSVSVSNLTSSTSSLAVSEAGNQMDDSSGRKSSHGKRKAPPIPIAFKPESFVPTVDPPVIPPKANKEQELKKLPAREAVPENKDKKNKSKKLMSSLTGIFRHETSPSTVVPTGSVTGARSGDSSLPKETEI